MSIADELITRGWTQGRLREADGRVCILGAACAAYGVEWDRELLPRFVLVALVDAAGLEQYPIFREYDITGWNDRPTRTYDEVLRAAKVADELLGAQ